VSRTNNGRFAPGNPGRPAGSKNKLTLGAIAKLAALNCDPLEGLAKIALGDVPCPTCRGELRARYSIGPGGFYLDPDDGQERTCRTCFGSGREPISPELRGKVLAELASFVAPKLRAVDHSSGDGSMSPQVTGIRVRFVSPDGRGEKPQQRVGGTAE
jgi:hypothetical protein